MEVNEVGKVKEIGEISCTEVSKDFGYSYSTYNNYYLFYTAYIALSLVFLIFFSVMIYKFVMAHKKIAESLEDFANCYKRTKM